MSDMLESTASYMAVWPNVMMAPRKTALATTRTNDQVARKGRVKVKESSKRGEQEEADGCRDGVPAKKSEAVPLGCFVLLLISV